MLASRARAAGCPGWVLPQWGSQPCPASRHSKQDWPAQGAAGCPAWEQRQGSGPSRARSPRPLPRMPRAQWATLDSEDCPFARGMRAGPARLGTPGPGHHSHPHFPPTPLSLRWDHGVRCLGPAQVPTLAPHSPTRRGMEWGAGWLRHLGPASHRGVTGAAPRCWLRLAQPPWLPAFGE